MNLHPNMPPLPGALLTAAVLSILPAWCQIAWRRPPPTPAAGLMCRGEP